MDGGSVPANGVIVEIRWEGIWMQQIKGNKSIEEELSYKG
jgi:hypothetical protein